MRAQPQLGLVRLPTEVSHSGTSIGASVLPSTTTATVPRHLAQELVPGVQTSVAHVPRTNVQLPRPPSVAESYERQSYVGVVHPSSPSHPHVHHPAKTADTHHYGMSPPVHTNSGTASALADDAYASAPGSGISLSFPSASVPASASVSGESHGLLDPAAAILQDPLANFAGHGASSWSGGQDFFDLLGPLLDVQYEQWK